jgi:uncharacterized membrane protein
MRKVEEIINIFFETGIYNSNEYMQIIIAKILIIPILIILIIFLFTEILKKKKGGRRDLNSP